MNKLRLLNFDDLFLLRHLRTGHSLTSAARALGITQPAVSQRVRKMEEVFGCRLLEKDGRFSRLTEEGYSVCERATHALTTMELELLPSPVELTMAEAGFGISQLASAAR